ncbi:MAG: hypothetical protein JXX29_22900 [Deltaproteobacteria bacterium]|nr:hypothetical protein [Deltaproteobacteria bacterium]MBN2674548.1 hypothetical protein [Deltaproteobacteria bacterium]
MRRNTEKQLAGLVQGEFKYGERGYGPNQITSTPDQKFDYNAIGQMKRYNGFNLYFDVEGRLVEADKPGGTNIKYHYDDTGAKKLAIMKKPSEPQKIYRYIFGNYQIRNGKQTWFVGGGPGQAEITESDGLEVNLYLLDELNEYVTSPPTPLQQDGEGSYEEVKKPLPAEFMDLDGDGDYNFDEGDLKIAREAFWSETSINGSCGDDTNNSNVGADFISAHLSCSSNNKPLVWRYYHKDHLGGNTVVTDSMGDVVSTMRYHPYGQTAERTGQKPVYGFAGGEIEEEEELGLIQFGARWYAPEIGRWVSADDWFVENVIRQVSKPLEAGAFIYAQNNPINYIDPTGLQKDEYQAALEEGAKKLEDVKFGKSTNLPKKDIPKDWKTEKDGSKNHKLVYTGDKTSAEAVKDIFNNVDKWSLDCAEFVQVVTWYAQLTTMGDEKFNNMIQKNGGKLELRSQNSTSIETASAWTRRTPNGVDRKKATYIEKTEYGSFESKETREMNDTEMLKEAKVGDRVGYEIPRNKGRALRQNAIYLGDGKFGAHFHGKKRKIWNIQELNQNMIEMGKGKKKAPELIEIESYEKKK